MVHYISKDWLPLERLKEILDSHAEIRLSDEAAEAIVKCRKYLDDKMEATDKPMYGITTGFGSLYNVTIPKEQHAGSSWTRNLTRVPCVGRQILNHQTTSKST